MEKENEHKALNPQSIDELLSYLRHVLSDLEYGTIQITVHDSKLTQVDRLEKRRFSLNLKQPAQE